MKEFSTRQLKVGQEIKHILADIFRKGDIYDPESFQAINVTISEVQVAPDLANATVFFAPLNGKDEDRMPLILNAMGKQFKFAIGKQMHIKKIPNLHFKLDQSFGQAQKMESILKND